MMVEENIAEDLIQKKQWKYVQRFKNAIWKGWQREYITAFCERRIMQHKWRSIRINDGDIVLVKGKDTKRGKWTIGIVNEIFQ